FVGPRSTYAALTHRSSGSMDTFAFSAASLAFAIAERMHFSIPSAARLLANRKTAKALLTSFPRIISMTRRAFCADPLRYFALAVASISILVNRQTENSQNRILSVHGLRFSVLVIFLPWSPSLLWFRSDL